MKIKSKHHLKGSDARKIIAAIEPLLGDPSALRKASLELAETDEEIDLIFVDGRPLIMVMEDRPFLNCFGRN